MNRRRFLKTPTLDRSQQIDEKNSTQGVCASCEHFRLAMRASHKAFFDLDIKTKKLTVTEEYAEMLGYDPQDEWQDMIKWDVSIHPEDREWVTMVFDKYVAGTIPEYRVEFRPIG